MHSTVLFQTVKKPFRNEPKKRIINNNNNLLLGKLHHLSGLHGGPNTNKAIFSPVQYCHPAEGGYRYRLSTSKQRISLKNMSIMKKSFSRKQVRLKTCRYFSQGKRGLWRASLARLWGDTFYRPLVLRLRAFTKNTSEYECRLLMSKLND